ncbi:unnamed protein product [Closterium sp. Naga37s-1]|nr:unnamed protein product [Closterium sp. Naga37s-1]
MRYRFWHSAHSHPHGASPLDQVVVDTSAAPSVSFSDALMKEVLPRSFPDGSEGEEELWRKGDGMRKGFKRIFVYILVAACMFLTWLLMRSYTTSSLTHMGRNMRAQLVQGVSAGMGAALATVPSSSGAQLAPTLQGTFVSFSGTFPGEDSSGHLHTLILLARVTNNTLHYTVDPSQPANPSLSDAATSASPVVSVAAQYLASAVSPSQLLSSCFFSPDHVPLDPKPGGTEQLYYVDACPVSVNASASSLQGTVQQQQQQGDDLLVISIVPSALILAPSDPGSDTVRALCISLPLVVLVIGLLLVCMNTSMDLARTGQTLREELVRQLVEKHRAPKKLVRQLMEKHRVEQRSNHKSQFLANMSHELRTPLAGIIGLLDLLACDALSPEQEAMLRTPLAGIIGLLDLLACDALSPEQEAMLRTPLAGIIGLLDLLACDALSPEQEAMVLQIKRSPPLLLSFPPSSIQP